MKLESIHPIYGILIEALTLASSFRGVICVRHRRELGGDECVP
jgi:hypothetical protein